jgi:hypothetical protein
MSGDRLTSLTVFATGASIAIAVPAALLLPKLFRIGRRSPAHRRFAWIWTAQLAIVVANGIAQPLGAPSWATYAAGGLVLVLGGVAFYPSRREVWRVLRGYPPR